MSSPTQRTLARLREEGWTVAIVEHWNQYARIRVDLFGFIDIIALRKNETLAVQATSRGNVSSRVQKIASAAHVGAVRDAGWQIQVWGWGKMANGRWEARIVDVS